MADSAFRISRVIKEPFCGLSHLLGSALSVAGLIVLQVLSQGRPWHHIGFAIYGTTLIFLYTASGMLHSLHCSKRTEDRLEKLDYIAIFFLIAGTYTPICLVTLRGPWGWTLLTAEWVLALFGSYIVLFGKRWSNAVRTSLYLAMGWLVVLVFFPLLRVLPPNAVWWLAAGGIVYSIGAVIFVLDRPHLWPGRFEAHDLWHVMVLVGSACHFMFMLLFVV